MAVHAALACLVATAATHAQTNPPRAVPVTRYETKTWTIRDGLPQNRVTAVMQARDGTLWLGTHGGLARFDGLRFEIRDLSNYPELRSNRLTALWEFRDGTLWIGTENRGLVRLRGGVFTAFDETAGLPSIHVRCLAEGLDHKLWIGTLAGLCALAGDQIERIDGLNAQIDALAMSPAGVLWIASARGLFRLQDGEVSLVDASSPYVSVFVGSDGVVWAGTATARVLRWQHGRGTTLAIPIGREVDAMVEDHSGAVWFTNSVRPLRWHRGRFEDPLAGSAAAGVRLSLAAHMDHEGSLWFGGEDGLHRVRPTPLSGVALRDQGGSIPRTVAAGADGRLWIGLQDGTLLRFADGQVTEATGRGERIADAIAYAADGSLWTASSAGLWRVRGESVERVDIALSPGKKLALLEDSGGSLWIGGRQRLERLAESPPRARWTTEELGGGTPLGILEARRGDFWIGTDTGLCRIVGDDIVQTLVSGADLPPGGVRALHETGDDTLWIGTYGGGICRVRRSGETDIIGTANGLYEGVVSRIVDAGGGNLVLQGNRALSLVAVDDLEQVANGLRDRLVPRVCDSGPGIDILEGMGGSSPMRCQTPDGALWFPSLEGLLRFDPAAVTAELPPPPVLIESLLVDGRRYPTAGEVVVPPGNRDLAIHFTAATFVDAQRVRFRYRLAGYSDRWHAASADRSAIFVRVPPGRYSFEVTAANRDGVWNNTGASISLDLQPWFSETVWFRVLVALSLIGGTAGAFFVRSRRARRRAAELESLVADRTRELQAARDHLEEKVVQRTSELADALSSLKRDVAKRHALEMQLRNSQKFEAIGRLAGGLAHDFNNILTAILSQADIIAETLEDHAENQTCREGLQVVRDSGQRAARLTRQLLAYSRQQVLQPHTIDANAAIRELQQMLERLVPRDIALCLELAPHPLYVHVDPGQFDQVIVNLVVNASEAIVGGGEICIESSSVSLDEQDVARNPDCQLGDYVLIAVTDSGAGIDDDTMEHIFEPFFTTKPHGEGTGLGLASVDGIVKQSGGTMRVFSEPSVGTTFKVYLPAAAAASTIPPEPMAPAPRGDATVLVCDDEPAVLRVTSRLLSNKGYSVMSAASPEAAIEQARSHGKVIDLLVTDLVMPTINGIELAMRLRETLGDIKVLYMSGYSPDLLVNDPDVDLTTQFLHKPFGAAELFRQVARVLA